MNTTFQPPLTYTIVSEFLASASRHIASSPDVTELCKDMTRVNTPRQLPALELRANGDILIGGHADEDGMQVCDELQEFITCMRILQKQVAPQRGRPDIKLWFVYRPYGSTKDVTTHMLVQLAGVDWAYESWRRF